MGAQTPINDAMHRMGSREAMKFLCLFYGDEKDRRALSKEKQAALLRQDEVP
jgi:hypothetical protein